MNVRTRAPYLTTLTTAIALALTGSVTSPAHAVESGSVIANDTVWTDTDGNPILAQGGNVLKVGPTYYWVGQKLVKGQPKAVNLYSSTDLENWTSEGPILSQSGTTGPLATGLWLGRPQLLRHPNGTFILAVEINNGPGGRNQMLFATSPTVGGTYTPTSQDSVKVNGNTIGDHSVFVDGSNAYLVYVGDTGSGINQTINIARLNTDWAAVAAEAPIWSTSNSNHNEAPAIVKVDGRYHLFASGMDWWDATPTSYRTSTAMTAAGWNQGSWKPVVTRPGSTNSFGTQFEQIIPLVGSQGTSYLYNGDRYSQFYAGDGNAPGGIGRNAWYPLTFEAGTPVLNGYTDVDVNTAAGTATGNRVANGRFDQDAAGLMPHWQVKDGSSAETVDSNTALGGNHHRQLSVYSGYVSQEVLLPDGTYELSFDYRSSGRQQNAYVEVKNHGSATPARVYLNTYQYQWAPKKITFTVTSGKADLGIWADAGGWLNIDNVAVWPTT
ncbi:family 43 glycosylhydrolase [Streptomyces sp. NPDC051001]|uniref:family 43 glycosylhydrolase n=1 Tax=Streptomyces sp. NPDC051001 TaxID=3155795 RepID=UPI00341A9E54